MRARVRQFTRVAAVLAVLLAASAADAASLGRQCRRACADEIAACVAGGGRRLACKRQMLGRCRTEGLGACQGSEASAVLAGSCASPTVIASQGGTFTGTTSGTSLLTSTCGSTGTSPEKVFQWTPAVSGTATIQTCGAGTNFDTVLYMRSGVCASGSEVVSGCNDDACTNATGLNRASRITPTVTAGQTYFIVVDGYGGAQGTFSLTVTPPGVSTTTTTRPPTTTTIGFTTTTTRPPTTTTSTTIFTTSTTPPPPTSLTATAPSCSEVDLRWTLSSGTASGYNVYRKASTATAFTLVKQVGATPVLPVADTAASAATTYTYGVAAWNSAGTSAMPTVLTNTPACATASSWVKDLGGSGTDIGYAVARDTTGDVIVTGVFSGTVNFGGSPLTSASGHASVFVAKYTAAGTHVWSRAVSGPGGSAALAVAVDSNGDVLVAGSFAGTVNFDGGTVTSTGSVDIFLAKYAGATGAYIWAHTFGDIANSGFGVTGTGNGVAVDSSNNVFLTGSFQGVVNFGGTNLSDPSLTTDVFVAKFNAAGVHQWSKNFPNTALEVGRAIAVDSNGNVVITGNYNGSINFGGGALPTPPGGQVAAFVAEFNSSGTHLWSRGFPDNTSNPIGVSSNGVACDSGGNVVFTGLFGNTVDFGGGGLTSTGSRDLFLAKYTSGGAFVWAHHYGGTSGSGAAAGNAVAVSPSDNVLVTGGFTNNNFGTGIDFGGSVLTSVSSTDVFVAEYTPLGALVWAKRFGGPVDDTGRGIAVDGAGNVAVTGNFYGTADFGTRTLTSSAGSSDVFLARLLASGSL